MATKTWTLEDIEELLDVDYDVDRNGGAALLAYLAGLAERGVSVAKVEREIDAEGCGMVAFVLLLPTGERLYAHFPGVPMEWQRRPGDFRAEWRAWDREEGNISEIFIQHEGYLDWNKAVEAGVRVATE